MGNINKALQFMITIANDPKHGYDQTRRNSPDYDCSSLVGTALNQAGFNVSPTSWTGNLKAQLLANGFISIPVTAPRQAGDIFLTEGKHVVMCVDSSNVVYASINELGRTTGGKTGDQTGKEILVSPFYTPPFGWGLHLRLVQPKTNEEVAKEVIAGNYGNGEQRKVNLANAGYDFETIQSVVNQLLAPTPQPTRKTNTEIAKEVIQGKHGNGETRKANIAGLGYDYNEIQKLVNAMLK